MLTCVFPDGAVDDQGDRRCLAAAAAEDDAGAPGQGRVDGAGEVFASYRERDLGCVQGYHGHHEQQVRGWLSVVWLGGGEGERGREERKCIPWLPSIFLGGVSSTHWGGEGARG